ncbi:MAG: hypothetical protein LBB83_02390 [Treponema sp.]|jgi:hypothetical protein|nr:hypothetical protein [Treponema sp.]
MSSISIKYAKFVKYFGVIIRLTFLALPALVMPLFAARWHPAFNAGEFPGAVFHPETVITYSIDEHGGPPNPKTVSEEPRSGLPADIAPPEEIARAFYRAVREDTESARGPGVSVPGESPGSPDNIPGPADEPDGESDGGTEREGWQLLGFIRDSEGIERRYFKERESGKITVITNMPESFPANADSAEGVNR